MQGELDDRNVQFSQTVKLAAALRAQGTPFKDHLFPDEIHDFLLHRTWLAAYQYGAEFLGRYLKTGKSRGLIRFAEPSSGRYELHTRRA